MWQILINPSLALILLHLNYVMLHPNNLQFHASSTIYEFLPNLSHEGLRMYWSQPESFYVSQKLKRFAVLSLKLAVKIDASYNSRTEPDATILTWYNIRYTFFTQWLLLTVLLYSRSISGWVERGNRNYYMNVLYK